MSAPKYFKNKSFTSYSYQRYLPIYYFGEYYTFSWTVIVKYYLWSSKRGLTFSIKKYECAAVHQ